MVGILVDSSWCYRLDCFPVRSVCSLLPTMCICLISVLVNRPKRRLSATQHPTWPQALSEEFTPAFNDWWMGLKCFEICRHQGSYTHMFGTEPLPLKYTAHKKFMNTSTSAEFVASFILEGRYLKSQTSYTVEILNYFISHGPLTEFYMVQNKTSKLSLKS